MSIVRWIVGALIFVAILMLSFVNAEPVTLRFFGLGSWEAPLILVVFCAFALGVTFGLMAGVLRLARVKRELKKARKALQAYEKDAAQTADAASPSSVTETDTFPSSTPPAGT